MPATLFRSDAAFSVGSFCSLKGSAESGWAVRLDGCSFIACYSKAGVFLWLWRVGLEKVRDKIAEVGFGEGFLEIFL